MYTGGNEDAVEEERYIRVLHNSLKRRILKGNTACDMLNNSHVIHFSVRPEQLPDMLEPDDRALLNQIEVHAKRQLHKGIANMGLL